MAAAILHFGQELDGRLSLLEQRGYSISCFQQAVALNQVPRSETVYDLVSLTDVEDEHCWRAADRARRHLLVPAILLRVKPVTSLPRVERQSSGAITSDYDLVISQDESPHTWIPRIDALISMGQRLRCASEQIIARSIRLRKETAMVTERTHREMERAKLMREQNDLSMPIPNMLADRILNCNSCGESFVFTAGDQLLFQLRKLMHVPRDCKQCSRSSRSL